MKKLFFALTLCFIFLVNINFVAAESVKFTPQVSLPGTYTASTTYYLGESSDIGVIGQIIKGIYRYGIGIVGIVAVIGLMAGGVMWTISAGNKEKVSEAKSWITSSLTGLILALSSYMILITVNPDLVQFKFSTIQTSQDLKIGCCEYDGTAQKTFEEDCKGTFYLNQEVVYEKGNAVCNKLTYDAIMDEFEKVEWICIEDGNCESENNPYSIYSLTIDEKYCKSIRSFNPPTCQGEKQVYCCAKSK